MKMEVQRIEVEGRRVDPVRNVERLWVEATAVPVNGCLVEGQHVLGTARIEIYADRLGRVLERVRTDAHRAAYEQCKEMQGRLREEWLRSDESAECRAKMHNAPVERHEAIIAEHWNPRPEHHLPLFGFRTGIPPLDSCKIVHPTSDRTMDAREWQKLDASKQREWLIDAPVTPMNAAQRANEHLANTISSALERLAQSNGKR